MALTDNDILAITSAVSGYISNMPAESVDDLQQLLDALGLLQRGGPMIEVAESMQAGIQAIREYMSPDFAYTTSENRVAFNAICQQVIAERIRHFESQLRNQLEYTLENQISLQQEQRNELEQTALASATLSGIVDGMYLSLAPSVYVQNQRLETIICLLFITCANTVARNYNVPESAAYGLTQHSLSSRTPEFPTHLGLISPLVRGSRRDFYRLWQLFRDHPQHMTRDTDLPVVQAELISTAEMLSTEAVVHSVENTSVSDASMVVARPVTSEPIAVAHAIPHMFFGEPAASVISDTVPEHAMHVLSRELSEDHAFFERQQQLQEHSQVEALSDDEEDVDLLYG
ncbi:MAG: hypothetical protein P1U61_03240 [Legionellaceae bacterium]|nr:hypothetical protein [Legionellaceae bacterium]